MDQPHPEQHKEYQNETGSDQTNLPTVTFNRINTKQGYRNTNTGTI